MAAIIRKVHLPHNKNARMTKCGREGYSNVHTALSISVGKSFCKFCFRDMSAEQQVYWENYFKSAHAQLFREV